MPKIPDPIPDPDPDDSCFAGHARSVKAAKWQPGGQAHLGGGGTRELAKDWDAVGTKHTGLVFTFKTPPPLPPLHQTRRRCRGVSSRAGRRYSWP